MSLYYVLVGIKFLTNSIVHQMSSQNSSPTFVFWSDLEELLLPLFWSTIFFLLFSWAELFSYFFRSSEVAESGEQLSGEWGLDEKEELEKPSFFLGDSTEKRQYAKLILSIYLFQSLTYDD